MKNGITTNGLIPLRLSGDYDSFELEYMPFFRDKGLSEEDSRSIITSIWIFANEQWLKGYNQALFSPDFNDS